MKFWWISFLLTGIVLIPNSNEQEIDLRRLDYERLNKVLFDLKKYGKPPNKRPHPGAVAASTPNPDNTRQYVCTTVMSANEVNTYNGFPENFKQNSRRIRVQYNDIDQTGNVVHGEKIVLTRYLENLIDEMRNDTTITTHPIVILYTYNIPCSIPEHQCAEELRKSKETLHYSLIVGFTAFFGHTREQTNKNKIASFHSLEMGNIVTFYMRTVLPSPKVYYLPPVGQRTASLVLTKTSIQAESADCFQSLLYQCLIKQPLAFCCTTNIDQINMAIVTRIISFSINTMIYSCVGSLQQNTTIDDTFRTCIKQWIQNGIGRDCSRCLSGGRGIGGGTSKLFIGQCAEQAEKLSNVIGASQVMDQPTWTKGGTIDRTGAILNRFNGAISCTPATLAPGLFCTRISGAFQGFG